MSRAALVAVAVVAALVVVLLLADPLGFFAGPAVDRDDGETGDLDPITGGPSLAGKPGAIDPATGDPLYIDGERVGVVDLGLGSASLKGLVTGEGRPLPGARVRLVLEQERGNHAVRTRRDGTWEIRGVPPGTPDLRATHQDYVGRTITVPEFGENAEVEVETIDLDRRKPSTDGLSVKVLDEFGRPFLGAKVLATTMPWGTRIAVTPEFLGQSEVLERRGLTDEQGEVTFAGMPSQSYDVAVMAEGYRVAAQAGIVVSGGRTRHLQFHLIPGVSISGTVVGPDGNPVAGAYVTGLQMPTFVIAGMTLADGAGRFSLDSLRKGQYWMMAYHDDFGQGMANPVPSPSSGLRLQLAGVGILELTVTRADGTPVPRYRVRPFQAQAFQYEYSQVHACTSADGRIEVKVPPGDYNLLVQGENGDLAAETSAAVQIGKKTKVTVVLPTSITVRGVVVDADGKHVQDAEVYVRRGGMPGGPKREQYARTDADGAFAVKGLPAETVKLLATKTGHASEVLELDLSNGEDPPEQTVRLGRGGTIEGRITRGEGTPAPGEQVNVFQDFFHPLSTTTDSDGRYRVNGLTPGRWNVSTGKFEFGAGGAGSNGIQVADGEVQVIDLDLGVPQGTRSLTGSVVQAGAGVADATVTVVDERGWDHVITTTTDAKGAFHVDGVQPGGVTVQVLTPSGLRKTIRPVVPAEGDVPPVTVALDGGGFRGRLTLMDGTPVSAAWIQVEAVGVEGWGRIRAQISSDTEGVFQARGLAPGTYQVRVTGSQYAGFLSEPFEVPAEGLTELGTYRLARGITLQGRVVDDTGAPVEDATISLHDEQGRPVYLFSLVTTGSDGRYAVTGLETGRYVVGFEAKGYAPSSRTVDLGGEGATADGVLSRGGAVSVTIRNEAGEAVPGIRVGLLDATGRPVERTLSLVSIFQGEVGRSGLDGVATVPDLAPGTYTLTVRSGGTIVGDAPVVRVSAGAVTTAALVVR